MPRTINLVKKAILKRELMNPKSDAKNALLKAGFSAGTAHNSTTNTIVKICLAEIAAEIDKPGLRKKAYATLERNLIQKKNKAVEVQAATSLLKFTEGEIIRNQDFDNPDEQSEYQRLRNLTASTN